MENANSPQEQVPSGTVLGVVDIELQVYINIALNVHIIISTLDFKGKAKNEPENLLFYFHRKRLLRRDSKPLLLLSRQLLYQLSH